MKCYRLILLIREGRLLFSEIEPFMMDVDSYNSGTWDKPITKVVTPHGDFHFLAFEKDYLDAFIAGIAVVRELKDSGLQYL